MRYILILFIWGGLHAHPLSVNLSAEAAILINGKTGAILYEKNIHKPYPPASITKVATALYVLERKGDALDEIVVASKDPLKMVMASTKHKNFSGMESILEHDGTKMGVVVGEELSIRSLLYGMMLVSGNDAANVLAHHISGSVSGFVQDMNLFYEERGILETTFYNPHGLFYPGHITTAYDMARIAQLAMSHPVFREIVKTVRYTPPSNNKKSQPAALVQGNKLLKPGKFYYPKAIGVKTGYTSGSKWTYVGAAEDENRELILVLLGCPSSEARFQDAISLFKAAFAEKKQVRSLFVKEDVLFFCPIKWRKNPLGSYLGEDISIEFFPSEEPDFKVVTQWFELSLPLYAGDHIGNLQLFLYDGTYYASAPLYAAYDVKKTFLDYVRSSFNGVCDLFYVTYVRFSFLLIFWAVCAYLLYKRLSKKKLVDKPLQ